MHGSRTPTTLPQASTQLFTGDIRCSQVERVGIYKKGRLRISLPPLLRCLQPRTTILFASSPPYSQWLHRTPQTSRQLCCCKPRSLVPQCCACCPGRSHASKTHHVPARGPEFNAVLLRLLDDGFPVQFLLAPFGALKFPRLICKFGEED